MEVVADSQTDIKTEPKSEDVTKPIICVGVKGQVKWFNVKRGYGFVHRHDNGEDLFIHQTSIKAKNPLNNRRSVGDKEEIEFDVVQGAKGLEAHNVTGPEGAPVQGSRYAQNTRRRRRGGPFRPNSDSGRMRSYSEGSDGNYRGRGRGMPRRFRGGGGGNPAFNARAPRPFMVQYRGQPPPPPPPQVYNPEAYMMPYPPRQMIPTMHPGQPPMMDPNMNRRHPMAMQNGYYQFPPQRMYPPNMQMRGGRQMMMPVNVSGGGRINNASRGGRYYNRHPRSRGDSATGPESDGEVVGRGNGRPYRNRRYRKNSRKNSEKQEPDSSVQENEQAVNAN